MLNARIVIAAPKIAIVRVQYVRSGERVLLKYKILTDQSL